MITLAQEAAQTPLSLVEAALFYALAALVLVSAWAIVASQNIVRMAVYLLLTLAGAAGFYFMLHAEFLAAIQLIVYAGGTLILIIFGVMLTSKNPSMQLRTAAWERFIGIGLAAVIAGLLLWAMVLSPSPAVHEQPAVAAGGHYQVEAIGRSLLSEYLVPFEVAGVLLLVVMIGAAFLARRRVRGE